ncbi:hypothetical protein [Tenacibaculum piscium]|uniref:hypothetical protein n=1 Tax=Tenacibaculum piscium TaxID=1458515 RepID=UPI001F1DCE20|nr:hypothetical protein [Tenacibaculum piscium]
METYIQYIILLLLVLLIIDRFRTKKGTNKTEIKMPKPKNKPSIIGESKVVIKEEERLNTPIETFKKNENKIIPKEALDDVFNMDTTQTIIANDWELMDEEEELKTNFSAKTDEDFNTGLSFEELQEISKMLIQKELTPEALPVAVKIVDTELLDILNEQIPQAQQRISELLDKHLKTYLNPKTTEDWRDFDIGEFV